MNSLIEQPLPILVMGIVLTISLVVGFTKTGKKWLLAAAAAVVVIVVGLLLLGQINVTEEERVEQLLHTIADAVERNDIDEAVSHVLPTAPGVDHARRELGRIHFQRVDIKSNLEIEVFEEQNPPTAEARFNVTVVADPGTGIGHYPRYVTVTLEKRGDRWKVRDYNHYEPTRGMRTDRP